MSSIWIYGLHTKHRHYNREKNTFKLPTKKLQNTKTWSFSCHCCVNTDNVLIVFDCPIYGFFASFMLRCLNAILGKYKYTFDPQTRSVINDGYLSGKTYWFPWRSGIAESLFSSSNRSVVTWLLSIRIGASVDHSAIRVFLSHLLH